MEFNNRSFLYGDGFFETMRCVNGKVQLLSYHLNRAKKSAEVLKMIWPREWDLFFFEAMLSSQLEECIVRITFYRNGLGTYTPTDNQMSMVLNTRPLIKRGFWLDENHFSTSLLSLVDVLKIETAVIYSQDFKYAGALSHLKSTSALFYVQAAQYLKEVQVDDLILLNHYGRVCEGLNSNVLVFLKGKWLTPSLREGPVAGTYLTFLQSKYSIEFVEIRIEDLRKAKLCLLTNSVFGIRRFSIKQ